MRLVDRVGHVDHSASVISAHPPHVGGVNTEHVRPGVWSEFANEAVMMWDSLHGAMQVLGIRSKEGWPNGCPHKVSQPRWGACSRMSLE